MYEVIDNFVQVFIGPQVATIVHSNYLASGLSFYIHVRILYLYGKQVRSRSHAGDTRLA